MDPLLRPEYLLLLLEQGERSLEGHTKLFLVLASLTTYPDDALCAFYDASLNIAYRAPSSEDGLRANFTAFVEWTLVRNRSLFPACSQENLASATLDPVPSPPSPRCAERMPEPTGDGEPSPAATDEPRSDRAEVRTEPELQMTSVKVREPATAPALRESATDCVSTERSSAPCTAAEGELSMACGLCHREGRKAPVPALRKRPPESPPVPAPRRCLPCSALPERPPSACAAKALTRVRASRAPSSGGSLS
ncbi:uncharacterized protein LOC131529176 [Onychostoma macrolepis]|uniref:uncharacterized protein LOC131529176 n=1 Tax=Onychostoma macrolepis TaxID=369639 RepID=UPI00272D4690|nr:uncharacterized protein LOC131529176 [Onychostoma macrolepis]